MERKIFDVSVLVLVGMLLLASCGGGGGGGGGSAPASNGSGAFFSKATPPSNNTTRAVYKSASVTDSDGTLTEWLYFYTGGSFEDCLKGTYKGTTLNAIVGKGTYTGNPAVDGTVTLTITHIADGDDGVLIEQKPPESGPLTITDGKIAGGGLFLGEDLVK